MALRDTYGLTGRIIADKYRVGELAALGGMSAVYHAHQIGVKRHVALKVLLPNLALQHPRMLGRFEREAHLAGVLTHENIAVLHDAGQTSDHLAYIVMEWLDGELLEAELQQPHFLSYQRIAYLMRQIAAALDAAHAARVIHRDLKPTNIMIVPRPDGRDWVKVFDFGLAKVLAGSLNLQISHALGTPHYASPEQFRPGEEINGQSDIYSLGVILYRMLTRHVPFDAPDMHELIRLHLLEMPPPLARWRPHIPATVEHLVTRMLAKTPHYRPATATEAVDLFEQAVQALPLAEREREIPVTPQLGKPAKHGHSTSPLTSPRARARKAEPNPAGARQAASFNHVRQTKGLKPPPPAPTAAQPVTPAPTVYGNRAAKPAAPKMARPAPTKPVDNNARTLLLIGVVALLLAALAGYLMFTDAAGQHVSAASFEYTVSPLLNFRSDSRRKP